MKIGILSYFYPPEPAFVPGSLAEELADRGHEVRVLTGFPSYPQGRVYPGYRQRWSDTGTIGGVQVRRMLRYPSQDGSAWRRAASYLTFAASTALTAPRYLADVDALYVYHPPATTFAAAGLLRLMRQVPVVLHVQDVWPDAVVTSGMAPDGRTGRMLRDTLDNTMRRIYRASAGIAVIAPSMRSLLIDRGADPGRIRVVLNWTDERLFRPVQAGRGAREAIGHRDRCTIMYAGNMGPFQRVRTAIRAAAATPQMDLVLVGTGAEERGNRQLAAELGAGNVRFVEQQPAERMAELYCAADYQLVMLRDLPALRGVVPAKLPAVFSCAAPVVASTAGDTTELVELDRAGLSCPPEDWRALADRFALATVIPADARSGMAQRARESYLRRMSLRTGVDRIEEMLREAAASRGR